MAIQDSEWPGCYYLFLAKFIGRIWKKKQAKKFEKLSVWPGKEDV
jgi:hypothetical protein